MTSYISVEAHGSVYLVRAQDQNVGRSLFVKQGRGEMKIMERAVKVIADAAGEDAIVGRQLLDVGANIGTTTISALRQHRFETAICFEPEPQNLLTLRLNLLINRLEDRAETLGVAVSDANGTAHLMVDLEQGGGHWIVSDSESLDASIGSAAPIEVPTVTLDQLVADGKIEPDRVALLWMDAQAHEGHILRGARKLVERGVPIVLEWDPRGLDEFGDRHKVEETVGEQYTHFVDLRPNLDPERPAFELRRGEALNSYASGFGEPGARSFTDLLVLRLEPDVAGRLDVCKLLDGGGGEEPVTESAERVRGKTERPKQARRPEETWSQRAAALRAAKRELLSDRSFGARDDGGWPVDPLRSLRMRKRSPEAAALRQAKHALLRERGGAAEPTPAEGEKAQPPSKPKPAG